MSIGGRLLMLNRTNSTSGGKPEGVRQTRGAISDLSHSSRKRLMQLCGSIDVESMGLPDFLTLTYPGEWPDEPERWKRDLRALWRRFDRHFPGYVGIWRIEPQERGAPHFHVAVWNAPGLVDNAGKEWISRQWFEVVGSRDLKHLAAGTSVEPVQTWRKWISYVSKYIAKVGKDGRKQVFDYEIGRYWGIRNKSRLKIKMQMEKVSADKFVRIRRVLKKMIDANKKQRGQKVQKYNINMDVPGLWCYLNNETVVKLLGLFENDEPLPF
ncbi:MAG: hypothetical protein Q7U10_12225 [Thermodesulfovibrionia bacterium]|nr:hypothetical protein [Thermodesulfovibrionia bacterium]